MSAITQTEAETRGMGGLGLYRATALLLIFESILMFTALIVLGSSINWPASLDEPSSVNLPLITEQPGAVILGYSSYLLYSVLIPPLALLLYRVLSGGDGSASSLLSIAVGFGVVSALARCLGILRWLFLMPVLAEVYLDPETSGPTRQAVSVAYDSFNAYVGGVGEVLGVGLFGGLMFGLFSVALVRSDRFPSWIGYAGLIVAALLLTGVLEIFGLDSGLLVTVSGAALQLWILALAVVLFLRSRSTSGGAQATPASGLSGR